MVAAGVGEGVGVEGVGVEVCEGASAGGVVIEAGVAVEGLDDGVGVGSGEIPRTAS